MNNDEEMNLWGKKPFSDSNLTSCDPILTGRYVNVNSSGTYYPAGSALLPGEKLNYDNYKELFGDDIPQKELDIIGGYTKQTKKAAKKHFDKRYCLYAIYLTCHSLFSKIFLSSAVMAIFTLPFYTYIQVGITNLVDKETISQFFHYLIVIFFISLVFTVILNIKIIEQQKTLDLLVQQIQKIDNQN